MSFTEFETEAHALGFDHVLERRWEPNRRVESHSHPFHARALVVEGDMCLIVGSQTRHLFAGDRFELEAHVPHEERYGGGGAVYWVARREAGTR